MVITVDYIYKYMVSVESEEILKSLGDLLWLQIWRNRKEAKRNSQKKTKTFWSDTRVLIWEYHSK